MLPSPGLCVVLACATVAACAPSRRPDVILISLDTVRADHVSAYGYGRATTPNLVALARDGVVFEEAVSQIPWTVGSHMSLLTSLYPTVHGVAHEQRQSEIPRTLTEQLQQAGYRTAAFVAPILHEGYGFAKGFDYYFRARQERSAESMVDRTLRWLADPASRPRPRQPLFLFLHLYDAHYPYRPPAPFDTAFVASYDPTIQKVIQAHPYRQAKQLTPEQLFQAVALYDAEIRYVDHQLGRLFAGLRANGLYQSSLIVVLSDHGEGFLEHGLMNHGNSVYEELIRVPLLLRFPGGRDGGRRVSGPVQLVDVAPTVLELARAGRLPQMQGRSLLRRVHGSEAARSAYVSGAYAGCLRSDAWKLIENPPSRLEKIPRALRVERELYDLRSDPRERRNLVAEEPLLVERLSRALHDLERANRELRSSLGTARASRTLELTDDQAQQLRALGYLQ